MPFLCFHETEWVRRFAHKAMRRSLLIDKSSSIPDALGKPLDVEIEGRPVEQTLAHRDLEVAETKIDELLIINLLRKVLEDELAIPLEIPFHRLGIEIVMLVVFVNVIYTFENARDI